MGDFPRSSRGTGLGRCSSAADRRYRSSSATACRRRSCSKTRSGPGTRFEWPGLLSGVTLRVLYYLEKPHAATDLARRADFHQSTAIAPSIYSSIEGLSTRSKTIHMHWTRDSNQLDQRPLLHARVHKLLAGPAVRVHLSVGSSRHLFRRRWNHRSSSTCHGDQPVRASVHVLLSSVSSVRLQDLTAVRTESASVSCLIVSKR